jgi:hypothetical protein
MFLMFQAWCAPCKLLQAKRRCCKSLSILLSSRSPYGEVYCILNASLHVTVLSDLEDATDQHSRGCPRFEQYKFSTPHAGRNCMIMG